MVGEQPVGDSGESGDGFVTLRDGSVVWGRFGAAGLLIRHVDPAGDLWFFVARRSSKIHHGGSWAIPGGALNRFETPLEGALREFSEEMGQELGEHELVTVYEDNRGPWSYWTLLVEVPSRFPLPTGLNWETEEVRWVDPSDLVRLELLAAFRQTLHQFGIR